MNRRPLREITDEEIRCYEQDGVVLLRGMFDGDWIERMAAAVDESMRNGGRRAREVTPVGEPGRFHMNVFMWRWNDDFRAFGLESPAAEIAARMMGVLETRFFYDQLFVKEPLTESVTHWHHDLPYWPVRGEQIATVWLALTPVSLETSGVEYVAGSHKWGKFYRAITPDKDPYFDDPKLDLCPNFSEQRADPKLRFLSFKMEPGDVTVHHPLTVHGSGGNHSQTQRRLGLATRFLGQGVVWDQRPATLVFPDRFSLESGTPLLNEEHFPIAWKSPIS